MFQEILFNLFRDHDDVFIYVEPFDSYTRAREGLQVKYRKMAATHQLEIIELKGPPQKLVFLTW